MNRFVLVLTAAGLLSAQDFTRDKEAAIGREMMAEVEREFGHVADPDVSGYVNAVAKRVGASAGTDLSLSVHVLKTSDSRAGFFRGGHLFLSAGLLLRAESEAQVAAVLAHELGHTIARHGLTLHGGAMPVTFVGVCTRYSQEMLIPLELKRASKGFEAEADALGREYLGKAGYDPQVMATVFQELRRPSLRPRPPAEPPLEALKPRLREALCNDSRKE
jgi:predicted Zn-dependent protease